MLPEEMAAPPVVARAPGRGVRQAVEPEHAGLGFDVWHRPAGRFGVALPGDEREFLPPTEERARAAVAVGNGPAMPRPCTPSASGR